MFAAVSVSEGIAIRERRQWRFSAAVSLRFVSGRIDVWKRCVGTALLNWVIREETGRDSRIRAVCVGRRF